MENDNSPDNNNIDNNNINDNINDNINNNNEENNNSENANNPDYNDIDEDIYMQELYRRLNQMRQERKDAQKDANLLNNRLNLLKEEERKTWKKIEQAKYKANGKLAHLKHIVSFSKLLENSKKIREQEIENKKVKNQRMNIVIKYNTEKNKAELKKQIEEEAKLLKAQKDYNKQLTNFLKQEKLKQNKVKCACVKNEKSYNDEKKKIIKHERRMRLKEELERKLIEEYRLKEEAEAKKCKAEQEEVEIIKKLQTTTQIHKKIENELGKINIDSVMRGDYGNIDNISINNKSQTSKNK